MKIKITGKELKITEAINDYVERKLDRIDKYFEEADAEVTLKTEKNAQIAEISIIANGESYRAVTEDKDLYASIDKDIDILEGQIRKSKTKKEKMMKDASIKTMDTVENHIKEISNEILMIQQIEGLKIQNKNLQNKSLQNTRGVRSIYPYATSLINIRPR